MNDAIVGAAATIPARNSAWHDWSNFDITFFTGFDQVTSPAFEDSQAAANGYGVTSLIDAYGGYAEIGYAPLDATAHPGPTLKTLGGAYPAPHPKPPAHHSAAAR